MELQQPSLIMARTQPLNVGGFCRNEKRDLQLRVLSAGWPCLDHDKDLTRNIRELMAFHAKRGSWYHLPTPKCRLLLYGVHGLFRIHQDRRGMISAIWGSPWDDNWPCNFKLKGHMYKGCSNFPQTCRSYTKSRCAFHSKMLLIWIRSTSERVKYHWGEIELSIFLDFESVLARLAFVA